MTGASSLFPGFGCVCSITTPLILTVVFLPARCSGLRYRSKSDHRIFDFICFASCDCDGGRARDPPGFAAYSSGWGRAKARRLRQYSKAANTSSSARPVFCAGVLAAPPVRLCLPRAARELGSLDAGYQERAVASLAHTQPVSADVAVLEVWTGTAERLGDSPLLPALTAGSDQECDAIG